MGTILTMLVVHFKTLFKGLIGLVIAVLLGLCINLHNSNKALSEGLEMANNNIEAYLGSLRGSLLANNVLLLNIEELQQQNDKLLHDIDSVREKLNLKSKEVRTAATQTQTIYVTESKGVRGDIVEILKDTTYTDSIQYNPLTTVHYTIGKDTINIGLDIENTQYLYVYKTKTYKNKKNFLKRLFTLDFKKVTKTKYVIENSNDLFDVSDVRIIESNTK